MFRWTLVVLVISILLLGKASAGAPFDISNGFKFRFTEFGGNNGDFPEALNQTNDGVLGATETESETIQGVTHGDDSSRGKYPFIAGILVNVSGRLFHICSGSIYNRYTIVTAAHCLRWIGVYPHIIALGIYNITQGSNNPGSQLIAVKDHVIHSGWSIGELGFPDDIALLFLECLIKYNSVIQPARLASRYDGHFVYATCYVIGWGFTETGRPALLQEAEIYGISNELCRLFWLVNSHARVLSTHFCVYKYPISNCFGDSGGPVICNRRVAGIVSWGRSDCSGCSPSASTRVSSYLKWIHKHALLH